MKKYSIQTAQNAFAYQLKEFNTEIKKIVDFYEKNPNFSRKSLLLNSLKETTSIMRESCEKLLERNEKLDIIVNKSKNLSTSSNDMLRTVNIILF